MCSNNKTESRNGLPLLCGFADTSPQVARKITLPQSPPPTPVHTTVGIVAPATHAKDNFHTTNDPTTNVPASRVPTVTNGATPVTHVHDGSINVPIAQVPVTNVPTVVNGVWKTQYTTSKQPCKNYLTRRGCSRPNCRNVHDMNARREYIAGLDKAAAERKALMSTSKKVVAPPQANIDTSNSRPEAVATYASTAAKGMAIDPNVVVSTPPATSSKASFWGTQTGLAIWAKKNLFDRSQLKLLMPYVSIDQVPAEVMEKVRNPNKPVDGRVFQLFSALPGELRNQIWGYAIDDALLEGRRVKIQLHADVDFDRITTRNSPPSLLHTCMESRSLAKLAYEPAFGNPVYFAQYYVPFNFEHDVLYIHTRGAMELCKLAKLMGRRNCARVKHVMVSLKEYLGDRSVEKNYWGRYMSYFRNLKSLKLVVGIGFEDQLFHKKSYCQGATFVLKEYLLSRYGKSTDKAFPSPADMAPKVDFEFIHAITAHELSIDNLIYQGEGGWGVEKRGW